MSKWVGTKAQEVATKINHFVHDQLQELLERNLTLETENRELRRFKEKSKSVYRQ